jgi:serine protease AprX
VAPGERIISCAAGTNLTFIENQLRQQGHPPIVLPPSLVEAAVPVAGAAAAPPAAAGVAAPASTATEVSSPATSTPPQPPRPVAAYIDESGTSMAAPHVSGAIAAFLSIRREFIGKPLEVKRIFLDSATGLGRERYFEGNGLLDLMRAIQSV